MNREIDFRFWDKINKIMVYHPTGDDPSVYESYNAYDVKHDRERDEWWNIPLGHFFEAVEDISGDSGLIAMQYTGIKDKNGKKIYEGDIVNVYWDMANEKNGKRDEGNYEVYWRFDRWHLKDKNGEDYDNGDYYYGDTVPWEQKDHYVEIIGNIYETPELLQSNDEKKD